METSLTNDTALFTLASALSEHFRENGGMIDVCRRNEKIAAVHDGGDDQLEVYRLFERDAKTATHMRRSAENLPPASKTDHWKDYGVMWEQSAKQMEQRMTQKGQIPIVTRWIAWEGLPVWVHGYKFDAHPNMKLELILPDAVRPIKDHPLRRMSTVLRCHEFLVPQSVAKPLAPYDRHETKFQTIIEYLLKELPEDMYTVRASLSSLAYV